jgi:FkbM family methyltransferase
MQRKHLSHAFSFFLGAIFTLVPLYILGTSAPPPLHAVHIQNTLSPTSTPANRHNIDAAPTAALSTPTKLSPGCRLSKLLSTNFSQSHSHFGGDHSCSAPFVVHDNQHLHPTVASLCFTKFSPNRPFKLFKHPHNIEYVMNSKQEKGVSRVFVPTAATCLNSPGLIIDMGTNEGAYSMAAASLGCTVITIDPQSLCTDIFKRALLSFPENAESIERVFALNAAATWKASTFAASIDSCYGCYMTDGVHVACGSSPTAGNWLRKDIVDGVNVGAAIDALGFSEVLLLHVDTEGHETSVLRGLEAKIMSRSIKNIIVELKPPLWNSGDDIWLRRLLVESGYKCWVLFQDQRNTDNLPPLDLASPLIELDMFCSIDKTPDAFIDNDTMLSCADSSI